MLIEEYEPWLVDAIPESGETAIDVGANRGIWTRGLAKRFRFVYAVEPNPEIFPILKENLPANVAVFEVAAWDEEKLLSFTQYELPEWLSASNEGPLFTRPPLGEVELAAVPLDVLPIKGKVDFIKIDTEGAEYPVLLGAESLIAENRPALLVEIHAAENGRRVSALLEEWGYRYREIEHPLHSPDSPYRAEHFWITAQG